MTRLELEHCLHGHIPLSSAMQVRVVEPDRRLDLLHENVKKYGTVFNTVAPGAELSGVLRRKRSPE